MTPTSPRKESLLSQINSNTVIEPVIDILNHIKGVQSDMITLSERASTTFYDLFEQNDIPMTTEVVVAFQYQDIFSQQLGAVVHAVTKITEQLSCYMENTKEEEQLDQQLGELRANLNDLLDEARSRKVAFMGDALNAPQ
jgi:hypothetical protein